MRRPRFIALLLALITLLAYLPVAHDSFLNYDDNGYVTENQRCPKWFDVGWNPMGIYNMARVQLAPAYVAVAHAGL